MILPEDKVGVSPAMETCNLSVGELLKRLDSVGDSNFIPRFSVVYKDILSKIDQWLGATYDCLDDKKISEIQLPEDKEKELQIETEQSSSGFLKGTEEEVPDAVGE